MLMYSRLLVRREGRDPMECRIGKCLQKKIIKENSLVTCIEVVEKKMFWHTLINKKRRAKETPCVYKGQQDHLCGVTTPSRADACIYANGIVYMDPLIDHYYLSWQCPIRYTSQ